MAQLDFVLNFYTTCPTSAHFMISFQYSVASSSSGSAVTQRSQRSWGGVGWGGGGGESLSVAASSRELG